MKKIYLIALLCFTSAVIYGQTKRAYIKAADKAYDNENYYAALTYYSEALEFDEDNSELIFKVAESARKFNAYDIAADKYAMLVDSMVEDSFPMAVFHLADMKQRLGDYESALQYYNIYDTEYSGIDNEIDEKVNNRIEYTNWAISRLEDLDKSAEVIQMEGVNSPFSDFGAIKKDDVLYYSTMSHDEADPADFPPRNISKIHSYQDSLSLPIEGPVNETDQIVAHTSFSKDGNTVYYTVCEFINADNIRCDIYNADVTEDGIFENGTKLGSAVNIDSFTTTQPHIAFDAIRQQEVLYFVSDRPDGKGKLDIYYSVHDGNGNYSEAKNLEFANTAENDVTPFYLETLDKLYFSSDGRLGLGGYDIYSSSRIDGEFGEVESLRAPVNSSYHDLYYTIDDAEENGMFSSNRDGSMYVDPAKKACCFDIYEVKFDEVIIDLNAITFDSHTKRPLYEATVHLVDAVSGDTITSVYSETDSSHLFTLRRDREYILVAERAEYNTKTVPLSTSKITSTTELIENIYMTTDKMQLDLFTFNKRTKAELEGVTVQIVDVTDPNNPIFLETNDLSNDFHAYLELGKKYEITAAKFGFVTEKEIVDLTDVTEPGLIKKEMYLEVFDIEDYLPVTVYFDNDYPNPKSNSTLTNDVYGQLYNDYIMQKGTFIKKVARKKGSVIKEQAELDVAAHFEGDVVGGYETLKRFMRALKKELELGRSLELAVKGYTSPVAETKYNLALGQRRVASVKNDILAYEGGVFIPYVEKGQLIITDISFGEELSPSNVSDDRSDVIGSVYSVGASKQRRVEVVSITDQ